MNNVHFPAKNTPKNQIIFSETFEKSFVRLSRLGKISSCARLSRLVNPSPEPGPDISGQGRKITPHENAPWKKLEFNVRVIFVFSSSLHYR